MKTEEQTSVTPIEIHQQLLRNVERIHNIIRNDEEMLNDSEIVTEVFSLSYTLLLELKKTQSIPDELKRAARLLKKCYPKDSIKLNIFTMNLMNYKLA